MTSSDTSHRRRRAAAWAAPIATLVVLGVVLYSVAVGQMSGAMLRGMGDTLRRLAAVQEDHFREAGTYSADAATLGFTTSSNIRVQIRADSTGWSAEARPVGVDIPLVGCAIHVGEVQSLATVRGIVPSRPGEVFCDGANWWSSITRIW